MSHAIMLALFLSLGVVCSSAHAEVLPGTTELKANGMKITAINDTMNTFKTQLFPGIENAPEKLKLMPGGEASGVCRTFLVEMKDHLVLIDTGWGKSGPRKGQTLDVLAAKGIRPEDITDILLTHLDGDHITGLTTGAAALYPNAKISLSKAEYEGWILRGDARNENSIANARKLMALYQDKYNCFEFDQEVLPGIVARNAAGHTIGHTLYELGGENGIAIVGDLLHAEALHMRFTDYSSRYDQDKKQAAASREYWLAALEKSGKTVAGMHFPSIGKVVKLPDGGYEVK